MKNKDEFSMTKIGLSTSNSQQNLLALDLTRNSTRHNFTHTIIKSQERENIFKSLPNTGTIFFYSTQQPVGNCLANSEKKYFNNMS